jgi:hypothetical protein
MDQEGGKDNQSGVKSRPRCDGVGFDQISPFTISADRVVRSGRNKASSHSPVDHLFLLPAGYFSPREQANFDQLRETGDPNLHSLSRAPTRRTAMHNTPTPGRHSQGRPALSTALPAVRYSVAAPLHDASYGYLRTLDTPRHPRHGGVGGPATEEDQKKMRSVHWLAEGMPCPPRDSVARSSFSLLPAHSPLSR